MLRPPHSRYHRLYCYHLDSTDLAAIDHPDLIGAWPEGDTTILFFHTPQPELLARLCAAHHCAIVYAADLDYRDWEAGLSFIPFQVEDLTVAPLWESQDADIVLDPSVIFGSGFHPTTRLCLESMLQIVARPACHSLLDLGTGTGLLAIAAARRGVQRILAVDANSLACAVCRANCDHNAVGNQVTIRQMDLFSHFPEFSATVLTANLHPELLCHLMALPAFWQSRYYILSGFLAGQEERLLALLPTGKVRFISRIRRQRWCCWTLEERAVS